jgi:putative heme-binding domain-containing protein
VLTGIVTAETANGLTLRQADGKDETIARTNLESLRATGQSLMPEGLEAQLPKQAMADLVAYLQARR